MKTNTELLSELNRRVHGHERAKKALITLFSRARKRHYMKYIENSPEYELIEPCKLLLIGDSGTGKTFLVEQLSKITDVPLLKLDATQLSPGKSKDSNDQEAIINMFNKTITDWLMKRKKDGYTDSYEGAKDLLVVYIDEFDKLALSFESTGNWNKQIQNSLLTLIDNHDEWAGVSFIFSGAFSDMKRPETKNGIGFFSQREQTEYILDDAIIKHGLVPELVGRLTAIVELDKFDEADYRRIVYERLKPNSRFSNSISDTDVSEMVKKAMSSRQGVRYLKRQLDAITLEIEFNGDEYELQKRIG